jgi:O-antigen ligase
MFIAIPVTKVHHVLPTDLRIYDIVFGLGFFVVLVPRAKKLASGVVSVPWLKAYFWFCGIALASVAVVFVTSGPTLAVISIGRLARFVAFGIVASAVVVFVRQESTARRLQSLFLTCATAEAGLSTLQSFDVVPQLWPKYWLYFGDVPCGTLSPHHLHPGMVYILGVALSLAMLITDNPLRVKVLSGAAIPVLILGTFAVRSRTAWAALAVVVALVIVKFPYRRISRAVTGMVWLAVGLVVVSTLTGQIGEQIVTSSWESGVAGKIRHGGVQNLSITRVQLVLDLPNVIKRQPWILLSGTGIQNAGSALRYGNAMHNGFLHSLVETGIFGFFLYLLVFFRIHQMLRISEKLARTPWCRAASLGGFFAFGAVVVSNLANETLYMQYSMMSLIGQILLVFSLAGFSYNTQILHSRSDALRRF